MNALADSLFKHRKDFVSDPELFPFVPHSTIWKVVGDDAKAHPQNNTSIVRTADRLTPPTSKAQNKNSLCSTTCVVVLTLVTPEYIYKYILF